MPLSIGIAMVSAALTSGAASIHVQANGDAHRNNRARAGDATGRQRQFNIVNLANQTAVCRNQNRLNALACSAGFKRRRLEADARGYRG